MAGKFTNLRYDNEAYNEKIQRSTDPLLYKLDPHYVTNCNPCFPRSGPVGQFDNQIFGDKIDVDSILRGYNRVNTKSNRSQIPQPLPSSNNIPVNCNNAVDTEYSRYTHPKQELRGAENDIRFGYPLVDPQCHIFDNLQINTRLQAKDDHKTVWQVPMDQNAALPRERLNRVKNCKVTIDCNYAPF